MDRMASPETQPIEGMKRVRAELNACANFLISGGSLQDSNVKTVPSQCKGARQAANAAACNDNALFRHVSLSRKKLVD